LFVQTAIEDFLRVIVKFIAVADDAPEGLAALRQASPTVQEKLIDLDR
jgi:hypothetical protein